MRGQQVSDMQGRVSPSTPVFWLYHSPVGSVIILILQKGALKLEERLALTQMAQLA